MPNLLTHERFKEELRAFTRGALRAELQELGNRVRQEIAQDLRDLPLLHVGTPVPGISPATGKSQSDAASSKTRSLQDLLAARRQGGDEDSMDDQEVGHAGFLKSLKSWKVVENHKLDRGQRPRKPGDNLDPKFSPRVSTELQRTRAWGSSLSPSLAGEPRRTNLLQTPNAGQHLWRQRSDVDRGESGPQDSAGQPDATGCRSDTDVVQVSLDIGRLSSHAVTPALGVPELPSPSSGEAPRRPPHREVAARIGTEEFQVPDSPKPLSSSFIGIVPASKLSWLDDADVCSEVDAPSQSGHHEPVTDKLKDPVQMAEASNSLVSSSEDPFGKRVTELYYQRDSRRKGSSKSQASRQSSASMDKRSRCYSFILATVEDCRFQHFMALVIFANLFTVGLQTDYLASNVTEHVPIGYTLAESVFCAVFLAEILARIYVYRLAFFIMPGWQWNVFDCFMVVLQTFEQLLELLIMTGARGGIGEGGFFSFGFLRALRILRVIRLLRAARIVEHVRELQTIVLSIGSSVKSLCWTLLLMALLIYTVGVSFTQLVLNHRLGQPDAPADSIIVTHYGSLGASILTLYGSIMGGVDWVNVVEPLLDQIHPLVGVAYSFYVAFAVLAMMNVVTGVFVEASLKTARDHHEAILLSSAGNLFQDSDMDESGHVTWKEFESRLDHPDMQEFFKSIDVDVSEAETVFHLMDMNEKGSLDVDQFMGGCLRLRGPAKAVDLAMLMHETRRMARRHAKQMSILHKRIESILAMFPQMDGGKEAA